MAKSSKSKNSDIKLNISISKFLKLSLLHRLQLIFYLLQRQHQKLMFHLSTSRLLWSVLIQPKLKRKIDKCAFMKYTDLIWTCKKKKILFDLYRQSQSQTYWRSKRIDVIHKIIKFIFLMNFYALSKNRLGMSA